MTAERLRDGYLVVADIAGYTQFLTANELEHAHAIIEELVAVIRARLAPPLTFVKLEGDAVFCRADGAALHGGERLLEVIEACYLAFSDRLLNIARATTCPCAACASIDSLDLKFIAHHGNYIVQDADGGADVAGPDVILAHRLLKNTITQRTGAHAYAFFTDAAANELPPAFELPRHVEACEPFGDVGGVVYDLGPALQQMREARREYVAPGEADYETLIDVRRPPSVVWQYLVDPVQRTRWACTLFNREPDASSPNSRGRSGVGTRSHCNHGPGEAHREIIDWRPFEYFTCKGTAWPRGPLRPARDLMETFELTARPDGGTRIAWRTKVVNGSLLANVVSWPLLRLLRAGVRRAAVRLEQAMAQDLGDE